MDIDIEHLCFMIHSQIEGIHSSICKACGYLERIQKPLDRGGFATEGSMEEIMLARDIKYLRDLAEKLDKLRHNLIANSCTLKISA
jgi:hypothetical protein